MIYTITDTATLERVIEGWRDTGINLSELLQAMEEQHEDH